MQPYVIAMYMGKGIPMLWNGQEFGENWGVPNWGIGRNLFERPLHWEYFYDFSGKALIRLYRIMGAEHRNLRGNRRENAVRSVLRPAVPEPREVASRGFSREH